LVFRGEQRVIGVELFEGCGLAPVSLGKSLDRRDGLSARYTGRALPVSVVLGVGAAAITGEIEGEQRGFRAPANIVPFEPLRFCGNVRKSCSCRSEKRSASASSVKGSPANAASTGA